MQRLGDAELRRMSVARCARGSGVSAALVEAVVRIAAESGYRRVVLSTSELQVQAKRLYLRLGFAVEHQAQNSGVVEVFFMARKVRK